MTVRS